MTAIRKHMRDFVAIIILVVIAAVVGGYILSQQRLNAPAWVPVFGKDYVTLKAQFTTAQAVTPGQGQSVSIAGVKVGEISRVDLKEGVAVVEMNIEKKYANVYRDASLLLRPKTGLKDMFIELTPGTPGTGRFEDGDTIPVSNTLPDVNLDEILSALDRDTRDYLMLLVNAGGKGLQGQGPVVGNALRRFEPLSRDVEKLTRLLVQRRQNLKRVVSNFRKLSDELATKDTQLAEFVENSNAVFQSLATQEANIRSMLRELPAALEDTDRALGRTDRLARELGPTLSALRPGARALGPSLRQMRPFLRESTPIIENQLRPFTRAALPVVTDLRVAAGRLSEAAPDLVSSFKVLNYALNELAYNPDGVGKGSEGYLFWLAWANHAANTIFGLQDAHGPIRRGLVLVSCAALGVLDNISAVEDRLTLLTALLNAPTTESVCPTRTGAGTTARKAGR